MRLLLAASVAFTSLVGTLLGYDIGIISGAILYIEKDLGLDSAQASLANLCCCPHLLAPTSNPSLLGTGWGACICRGAVLWWP